jgi:hypothetical protein
LLSLARYPALGRVLVIPNNPVLELYGQFLRPHGLVFALTCTVNCGTLGTGVCLYKSCPINGIYHRWTPIKL